MGTIECVADAMAAGERILPARRRSTARGLVHRWTLASARADRLFFAQVREDPRLEIEALAPSERDVIVAVSSGGCTVLSLLAAGAARVIATDVNPTQNHLVELKAAATARLPVAGAIAFLGGMETLGTDRWHTYGRLRADLTGGARAYWDARPREMRRGVLNAGVSERFLRFLVAIVKAGIHPPSRIRQLLSSRTLDEQRRFYHEEWDTRRWRGLYTLLLNRRVFRRTYDPAFFAHVENPSFSEHFRRLFEYTVTELPVRDNYFLHHMLTGRYPIAEPGGVPPYLSECGEQSMWRTRDRLMLVDGTYTECLRRLPDGLVTGFALSNICEWLDLAGLDELWGQIVRTAAPGATLCYRNFVGWTEIPARWRDRVEEDRARGAALSRLDRSTSNRRFVVCRIRGASA